MALRRRDSEILDHVEFEDEIPEIIARLKVRWDHDQEEVAESIADMARTLAPVLDHAIKNPPRLPGMLRDSIETRQAPEAPRLRTAVTVGRFWGLFQEYGTEHHDAQPFLRPALAAHEAELTKRMSITLRKTIRQEDV